MLAAIISLALLGLTLGYLLGLAAIRLKVEEPEIVQEIEAMLPGTNCGQCGLAGCPAGAKALAQGTVPVTLCPPGGKTLAEALAHKLGVTLDLTDMTEREQQVAVVIDQQCIGCTRCIKVCPTDAIVGAPKQLHCVVSDACTGCDKCIDICPTMGIKLRRPRATLGTWQWPKPIQNPMAATTINDTGDNEPKNPAEVA